MVNSRQALGATRVLVTLYGVAVASATLIAATAIGTPGAFSDTVGVQTADVAATVVQGGVSYDIVKRLAIVVDVTALPNGVTFPGPAVACTAAEAASTAGIVLAPVQPSAAEFVGLCNGTLRTYSGAEAVTTGVTADGLFGNLALGLGGQPGAHLLATGVASDIVIAKGDSTLEKLAYVVGLFVRLTAIVWLLYTAMSWLWARRPAVLRSAPRALAWGRA